MNQEQRIEYFMSEIARLSNQVVDLQNERDAMTANVEELLVHGTVLATAASMATGAMAIGSPVAEFCVEAVKRFNAAKAATPQQHLAEIRAQAVLDFVSSLPSIAYMKKELLIEANQYADSIRKGE